MHSPHTLTAQTRRAIATVFNDASRRSARGEQVDAAEIANRIDAILGDAFAKAAACAIHKARLEIRP
jgi:hypothetical protein